MRMVRRVFLALTFAVWLLALSACGGGNTPDAGPAPVITGLSTPVALNGQDIVITGLNFGTTRGSSSVSLAGLEMAVTAWGATLITATIPAGASTGDVVVEVNGRQSPGGGAARLEIRTDLPVLSAINPDHARQGDVVEITGQDFGTTPLGVVFITNDGGEFSAPQTPQWSDQAASVTVPAMPVADYSVHLAIGDWRSTGLGFTCDPGSSSDLPLITNVTPGQGTANTAIQIEGNNFGAEQDGSTLLLGDLPMPVDAWSATRIDARVPVGAASGKITINVVGNDYQWPAEAGGMFIVGEAPVVTGINPGTLRFDTPITIHGSGFLATRGTGKVTIGGTPQPVDEWVEAGESGSGMIIIDALRAFTTAGETLKDEHGEQVLDAYGVPIRCFEVVVTADNGLVSEPVLAPFETNLTAEVTVDQAVGERDSQSGEEGTVFTFRTNVEGGSGDYEMILFTDVDRAIPPEVHYTSHILDYRFPADPAYAVADKTYRTAVKIYDRRNRDSITVDGPQIRLVKHNQPVITEMAVYDFNNGGLPAPNEWCYMAALQTYSDISFVEDQIHVTSSRGDILVDGEPVPSYPRDLSRFTVEGDTPRGLGYRYYNDDAINTNNGSVISIKGLNFGDTYGELQLSAPSMPVMVTDFAACVDLPTGWSDEEIRFYLPPGTRDLSGSVYISPEGSTQGTLSPYPLICSPYVLGIAPNIDLSLIDGVITLTGFDFEPDIADGKTGNGTYSLWTVRVSYTDPWGAGAVTNYGYLTTPIPPWALSGTALQFNLGDLDVDGDGKVPVEVTSASGTESAVVEGVLEPGDYFFYLWTGVLEEGTPEEIAMSGIFSEPFIIQTNDGQISNHAPSVSLYPIPNNGPLPLEVTFNANAFDPDGMIIDYEWDFDGNGTFNEAGDEAAAQGNPGPHVYTYTSEGTYTPRVRVTDDGVPALFDIAAQTIFAGDGFTDNDITVNITLRDWDQFLLTSQTLARLYDGDPAAGGALLDQKYFDHEAAGLGNPATRTFNDVAVGTNYYIRVMNIVAQWDGDPGPPPMATKDWGPYSVPPNLNIDISGFQYQNPPIAGP